MKGLQHRGICVHSMKGSRNPLRRYRRQCSTVCEPLAEDPRHLAFFLVSATGFSCDFSQRNHFAYQPLIIPFGLQIGLRTLLLSTVLKMMCQLFRWVLCTWHH